MREVTAEVIAASRFDLVPLRTEHAVEMARVLADPQLYAFTGGTPPTVTELRNRYEHWNAGSPDPAAAWCNWAIKLRSGGSLAGWVQATISARPSSPVAEVAWVVSTPWQGQGIATEAARAVVGWLRRQSVRTVIAHIHPDHHASAAVARAIGLEPTDDWQDGEVRWAGQLIDSGSVNRRLCSSDLPPCREKPVDSDPQAFRQASRAVL